MVHLWHYIILSLSLEIYSWLILDVRTRWDGLDKYLAHFIVVSENQRSFAAGLKYELTKYVN